jgi:2'-5' RNA ligase
MSTIRAFIALPLPSDVKEVFVAIQTQLEESQADAKWDAPEKFHITLKFLGDIEAVQAISIAHKLRNSVGSLSSFEVSYDSLGAFPNAVNPKVVWIGAQQNARVVELQERAEQVCESFGFARENRPFHSHVTLGRVRGSHNLDRLTAKINSITFQPLIARCTEVHIMRSELKPAGSIPLAS